MAQLELDHVTKIFTEDDGNEIVAVDDIDFSIDDGEFLVLVGPSGCGKSTTLRMVAGLETVSKGEIRLGDTVINEKKPADRDIAMVFQSYALYPHMTVHQNMAFGLEESTDMAQEDIDERVESAADMMGIHDLLDRKPRELSGGQQQRVALGRAIVRDPEVFLMDEPLSNLDAKLRAQMRTELQRIQEDLGVTTIYVTHDQTEAMTMGDRIAILDDGVLQQVGTPLECYHEPVNQFVASFIGEPSMNFFRVEHKDGSLLGKHFSYPLSEETQKQIGDTTDLVLGIRPEDIEIRESVEDSHDFETVVDVVEPTGDENNIYLTFDEQASSPETFVVTISGMRRITAGQPAVAHVPEDAIHLFDRESGEVIRNRKLDAVESLEPQI